MGDMCPCKPVDASRSPGTTSLQLVLESGRRQLSGRSLPSVHSEHTGRARLCSIIDEGIVD